MAFSAKYSSIPDVKHAEEAPLVEHQEEDVVAHSSYWSIYRGVVLGVVVGISLMLLMSSTVKVSSVISSSLSEEALDASFPKGNFKIQSTDNLLMFLTYANGQFTFAPASTTNPGQIFSSPKSGALVNLGATGNGQYVYVSNSVMTVGSSWLATKLWTISGSQLYYGSAVALPTAIRTQQVASGQNAPVADSIAAAKLTKFKIQLPDASVPSGQFACAKGSCCVSAAGDMGVTNVRPCSTANTFTVVNGRLSHQFGNAAYVFDAKNGASNPASLIVPADDSAVNQMFYYDGKVLSQQYKSGSCLRLNGIDGLWFSADTNLGACTAVTFVGA